MPHHTPHAQRRPRARSRMLAAVLAAALAASGALLGAVPALADASPALTVTEAPRDGGPVTIEGVGFDATPSRFGIYLGIREVGAAEDIALAWVAVGNTEGEIPGMGATAPMNTDGSFSVQLTAPEFVDGVDYIVHTRQAHGGQDATQKTSTPLLYEALEPASTTTTLTVSPADTSRVGESIRMHATATPAVAGTFEFFANGDSLAAGIDAQDGAAEATMPEVAVGDYRFTATFTPTDATTHHPSTSSAVTHRVTEAVIPPGADPVLTVNPATDLDPAVENVLSVSGTGYIGSGAANGVYVLFGDSSIWAGGGPLVADGWIAQAWVRADQIVDGRFNATLTVPAGTLAQGVDYTVATSAAHGLSATDRTLDAFAPVAVRIGDTVTPTPSPTPTDKPVDPTPSASPKPTAAPDEPECIAHDVDGATVEWGVKQSFAAYVTGPIARGSISGGWGSGSGSFSTDTGNGLVSFGGAMTFTGHSGALDLTLSNPTVRVTGSTGTLAVDVSSKGYNGAADVNAAQVVLATLSLPDASISEGVARWSQSSATLTAAGAEAFAGFYAAGEALDAVSFTFPLGGDVRCDEATSGGAHAAGGLATTGAEPDGALLVGAGLLLTLGLALTVVRRRRFAAVAAE